jgi:hypothetical protein
MADQAGVRRLPYGRFAIRRWAGDRLIPRYFDFHKASVSAIADEDPGFARDDPGFVDSLGGRRLRGKRVVERKNLFVWRHRGSILGMHRSRGSIDLHFKAEQSLLLPEIRPEHQAALAGRDVRAELQMPFRGFGDLCFTPYRVD